MTQLRVLLGALALAALAATSACGEDAAHDCNDGTDNDGDGVIDDGDPGCALNADSEAPDPEFPACNDGVDNDGDGLFDTEDPGCTDLGDEDEYNEPLAACRNGLDDDEDGLVDFPNDPGCGLTLEDIEDDDCPSGPSCPACANGLDDDGDGDADYPDDLGCDSAADDDEFNADPSICGANVSVQPLPASGEAAGVFAQDSANELISPDCGGTGEEVVYIFEPTEAVAVVATTDFPETTADTVLYLRGECRTPATEQACNDDDGVSESRIQIDRLEPGTYYLVVDSHAGLPGDYRLQVETFTPAEESCDPEAPACAPGLVCRGEAGSEICQAPECRDGTDNDGDGLVDFPDEPGCSDADDNDEADDCPGGATCPACGNGVDDDGDGLIDFPDDPGCDAASSDIEIDECLPGVPVTALTNAGVAGTTSGSSEFTPSCSFSTTSPEDVFGYVLDRDDLVSLSFSTLGSSYDTVLSVRLADCGNVQAELACEDPGTGGETVTLPAPEPGSYFVFVDGSFGSGDYLLSVEGILPEGASCDVADPAFRCDDGFECDGSVCVTATCNDGNDDDGDGLVDFPDDPGCESISDADEADDCPSGAGCPLCGNGVDDDGDGFTDFPDDVGCSSASDDIELDECAPGVPLMELTDAGVSGTTPPAGSGSDVSPTCHSSTLSTEDEYAYRNTRVLESLTFSTFGSGTDGDSVLHVREGDCAELADEVVCENVTETVTIEDPTVDAYYYVFVDGDYTSGVSYVLDVSGVLSEGEACDPADTQFVCNQGAGMACSGGVCAPAACANGVDDDGDGLADAGDPGCESLIDDTEAPDPSPAPECADGVDNDGDGDADYPADIGCSMASDDVEESCDLESDVIVVPTASPVTGDSSGATDDADPSCLSFSNAPDVAHELYLPGALTSLSVDTDGSDFDTVLYLRTPECSADDYDCDDDGGASVQSALSLGAVPAGLYYIYVDGYSSNSGGYTLNLSGTIAAGEACDPAQTFLTCDGGGSCTGGVCQ